MGNISSTINHFPWFWFWPSTTSAHLQVVKNNWISYCRMSRVKQPNPSHLLFFFFFFTTNGGRGKFGIKQDKKHIQFRQPTTNSEPSSNSKTLEKLEAAKSYVPIRRRVPLTQHLSVPDSFPWSASDTWRQLKYHSYNILKTK